MVTVTVEIAAPAEPNMSVKKSVAIVVVSIFTILFPTRIVVMVSLEFSTSFQIGRASCRERV